MGYPENLIFLLNYVTLLIKTYTIINVDHSSLLIGMGGFLFDHKLYNINVDDILRKIYT